LIDTSRSITKLSCASNFTNDCSFFVVILVLFFVCFALFVVVFFAKPRHVIVYCEMRWSVLLLLVLVVVPADSSQALGLSTQKIMLGPQAQSQSTSTQNSASTSTSHQFTPPGAGVLKSIFIDSIASLSLDSAQSSVNDQPGDQTAIPSTQPNVNGASTGTAANPFGSMMQTLLQAKTGEEAVNVMGQGMSQLLSDPSMAMEVATLLQMPEFADVAATLVHKMGWLRQVIVLHK
jgi:hypothetical protein